MTSVEAERLTSILGGFPTKGPLDPKVIDEQAGDGYVRRLVEYTGAGGRITAFVLLPRPAGETPSRRRPGIVAIHQDGNRVTTTIGKSEPAGLAGDEDQAYGMELCRRGYIVVCPDRPGFEARQHIAHPQGLAGELFELHRAVDYLVAHAEVDARTIGAIGHSAGGYLTSLLMVTDPRVKAGVASCGSWLWRWRWSPPGPVPEGYNIPRPPLPELGREIDQDDLLAGIAPRPFLQSRGDPWPIVFEEELTRKARERYAQLAVPERFQHILYAGGHGFREDFRRYSYAWLARWLGSQ